MIKSINDFSYYLYHKFEESQNILFSGYSISSALSLAYLGSDGDTKIQIANVLGFSPDARMLEAAKSLNQFGKYLCSLDNGIKILNANSIWVNKGLELKDSIIADVEEVDVVIRKVDYINATELARKEINKWIADNTEDMISELIPKGKLNERVEIVLANAIHFDGKWYAEFDPDLTHNGEFNNLDGTTSGIECMYSRALPCGYFENSELQAISIPYGSSKSLGMLIILPKPDCFINIDRELKYSCIESILRNMRNSTARIWLPKFSLRYSNDLADILVEDMPLPFSEKADFYRFGGTNPLYISHIIHESSISIDESGTIASGSTAVIIEGYGSLNEPAVMINRPFIFMIYDRSHVPLFLGRVVKL